MLFTLPGIILHGVLWVALTSLTSAILLAKHKDPKKLVNFSIYYGAAISIVQPHVVRMVLMLSLTWWLFMGLVILIGLIAWGIVQMINKHHSD